MPPRKVSMVAAVTLELKPYPADIRLGSIGRSMMLLAQRLDQGGLDPRDLAQVARELRLCSQQLRDMAPGDRSGDEIDAARKKREERLQGGAGK